MKKHPWRYLIAIFLFVALGISINAQVTAISYLCRKPYDLRHTHATLLLKAGVYAKIISERLGHSSIALTLDVYSHVLPSMQAEAAQQIEKMLFSGKK